MLEAEELSQLTRLGDRCPRFSGEFPRLRPSGLAGTDVDFFAGVDHALLPSSLVPAVTKWCEEVGPGNTALQSEGARSDEPLEVYYLKLGTREGHCELKAMLTALAPHLIAALTKASSALTEKRTNPKRQRVHR
jgi:hypothetical protein